MSTLIDAFSRILNDVYTMRCLLLTVQTCSFFFKSFLLFSFARKMFEIEKQPSAWKYLFVVIACSALEDFTWMLSLSRYTFFPTIDYRPIVFIIRLTWATNILLYQSLALFIESFIFKARISIHQMFSCCFSFFLGAYPLFLAFYGFQSTNYRPPFEFKLYFVESVYALCILMPMTLLYGWRKLQKTRGQKILTTQLETVIKFFIFPHVAINIYQTFPMPSNGVVCKGSAILGAACSNIFLTTALFYCLQKIMRLRFLNIHSHVHSPESLNFADTFKIILDSLGSATTVNEVGLLTQRFFGQVFHIPSANVSMNIRPSDSPLKTNYREMKLSKTDTAVERFLGGTSTHRSNDALDYLKKSKILIYDEVEYDLFYESKEIDRIMLHFLHDIQADIFLPIYEQSNIIGYIIVERHARGTRLYNDIERDEMIVFASFLSKVINLLQNRDLNELLKQRKDIVEELYKKHQEINQYKESIRSFINNSERGVGIIFYKNGKFTSANQEAREMIEIDPNHHEGHPITKALRTVGKQALSYKTNRTELVRMKNEKQIVVMGIPQQENNTVIIIVYFAEMYDTIKSQIDAIRDPSDWDYLLYLETTRSGKLINQLIPGSGQVLLNFKIDLLKLALGKKALLLDLPEDDVSSLVELIHHISLRETLYNLELASQVSTADTSIRLFGINPLYGSTTDVPLLEKLNKKGTLVIKNVDKLDLESQENLAQFIRYGFYTIFKSDKRVQSDVRIICSTQQDLGELVEAGVFSPVLFNELKKASLTMPRLLTLPEDEMNDLVDAFTDQAMTQKEFKNLISLSHRDKDSLSTQRPISLNELKVRVQQILVNKSKKTGVYQETQFDPAYNITDPKLIEAARLGKHALKDPKLLGLLWNKFKSQNKIALFLGVNRSSVNRRCKEYQIS